MFQSILDDLKQAIRSGNMITRLIIINCIVFFITAIGKALFPSAYDFIFPYIALPGNLLELVTRPWTVITHMFIHAGAMHLLFNMLFLYWFGRIVGDLLGDRRILPLYFLGGLIGAAAYIISHQLLPSAVGPYAVGASAAIMCMVATAGAIAPDYIIRLIFIGDVRLKYVVLFIILMDLIGATEGNTGGHIAHLGGAALGFMFVKQLHAGSDISSPMENLLKKITAWVSDNPVETRSRKKKKTPLKVAHKGKPAHRQDKAPKPQNFQAELDRILDKIKEDGYESLSAEEKEFLFQASKK